MHCYDDGTLRAFLDRELPRKERWEIEAHTALCVTCAERLAALLADDAIAGAALSRLGGVESNFKTDAAWRRLGSRIDQDRALWWKGARRMSSRAKQYAAVAIAAVAVGSFAFTPVRTYAGNVLSVFRVSKINTLNITLDDMRQIRRGMERGGRINMESFGSISATGNRQITRVTLEEARRAVDFSIKLPQGLGDPTLNLQAASSINMNLKVNNINTFLKSMGGTKMLPSSLDGRQFTFSMPAAVTGEYGSEGSSVYVAESRSPELRAPEGTDVNSIRDALLDIPVLPDNIKTQLEAVNDWQHTILIPNVEGGSQKVIVNGQEGVFVGTPGGMGVGGGDRRRGSVNKDMKALVWQYGGVVYAVGGRLTLDKALAIAGSMK